MYCTHCGFENKGDNQFCENCGKSMTNLPAPVPLTSMWGKWASIGSALVVICFFLPWASVSCSGRQIISVTGSEIATGNYPGLNNISDATSLFGYNPDYSGIPSYPAVLLLPLIGAVGFFVLNGKRESSIISMSVGALGCIGLLILMVSISDLKNKVSTGGVFELKYEIGIWGQWLGNLIQLGFGYLSQRND